MCKFVNVVRVLSLIAIATAVAGPAFSQVPGAPADVEDAIDASVESAVEKAVSDTVESGVEETVESSVERTVEQTVESGVQQSVENAVESGVAGAVESALEQSVASDVENAVSSVVEGSIADDVLDETLDGAVGETAGAASSIVSAAAQGASQSGDRTVEIIVEDGRRVIRHEWVLVVSAEEAAQVEALGAPVVMRAPLEASGDVLFVLRISDRDPNAGEIEAALSALGGGRFDRNSLFDMAAKDAARSNAGTPGLKSDAPGDQSGAAAGLIDTDVAADHPALAAVRIEAQDFVSIGGERPRDHGTAVASLLSGALGAGPAAGAPRIYAASVFFQTADGATGASTASLIRAIDWLRGKGVGVVNFSLTGAQNTALEQVIGAAQKDGVVFVAAVGNEGPAARPLYPAAYDGVIGVTAVDEKGEVYRWALQGPQVDVAARGVDVRIARPGGGYATDSGASLAAPLVAGFLARRLAPHAGPAAALDIIRASATPGDARDETVGYGVLTPDVTH